MRPKYISSATPLTAIHWLQFNHSCQELSHRFQYATTIFCRRFHAHTTQNSGGPLLPRNFVVCIALLISLCWVDVVEYE